MTHKPARPEGHGDHWDAIDRDAERTVAEFVPKVANEGVRLPLPAPEGVMMAWPGGPLRVLALMMPGQSHGDLELWSIYPFLAAGAEVELRLHAVHRWHNGIEAVLETSHACGAALDFFDPLYLINRGRYRIGEAYRFKLAALGYEVAIRVPEPIVIHDPETIARFKADGGVSNRPDGAIEFVTEGMTAYLPQREVPEDMSIKGPVQAVSRGELAGREYFVFRTTIARPSDTEQLDIDVFVTRASLRGDPPKVGDDLQGFVWLQGYLADSKIE